MKLKVFIILFVSVLLSGCRENLYTPTQMASVNLPQEIKFDNLSFSKKHEQTNSSEYYLNGEKDFDWSKLLTVYYNDKVNNLDELISALQKTHENANNAFKRDFTMDKISKNKAFSTEIYYPATNDSRYDKFEVNFKIYEIKNCGLVSVFYAVNFDKNTKLEEIKHFINNKKEYFLQNYPKIECK